MPRHIHEQTEVELICLLKDGKTGAGSVEFVVMHDAAEVTRVQGSVAADARAPGGKAATAKYTPPKVADDKASYVLTYKAIADGEEYKSDDEINVWPREGKLTSRNEDDTQPLKSFKFKVMQNGAQFGGGFRTSNADPSIETFRLDKGYPFKLEGVAPYEIVGDPEPQGGKLRDLKSKGKVTFKAEFVDPKRPGDGKIVQWVNLEATAGKNGTDGLGSEVVVTVGAEGDRDAAGTVKADPIGTAGVYVYVKVKFSGPAARKSLRNAPKTDLAAGLNLLDRVAVKEAATDPEWEFTGKVDLADAGGVGKFKLQLGLCGGDSCEVSIGSTKACGDATLTFTNWRKIWYELMAPDVMALRDSTAEDGTAVRDFPTVLIDALKAGGDPTFVKYQIYRSQSFTAAEANTAAPGSVLPRSFFQRATGSANCYLLTDYSFTKYPKNFDKGKGARGSLIKGCDVNLFNDGPARDADLTRQFDATSAQADYDLAANDPNILWSPNSAFKGGAGAASIRSIKWKAKIADTAPYHGPPSLEFASADDPARDDEDGATFTVEELLQNPAACTVTFKKPRIGHTATSLDTAAKSALQSWLSALWTDAKVRPHGFKLKIRATGRLGNARRTDRVTAIQNYITTAVAAAPALWKHRGLTPAGALREGVLAAGTDVDMARSHWKLIAVNLPAGADDKPGEFAGALSATHCPVAVELKFEPQHSGLGMAGQGAQKGELLLVIKVDAPVSVADIALHELGHQYGLSKVAHGLPGLANAADVATDEAEPRYQNVGAKGHFYTGKGHSGGHCAWGLTDAQKARATYNGIRGKCIMYGASSLNDGTRTATGFCTQCSDHIRAQDLSALK